MKKMGVFVLSLFLLAGRLSGQTEGPAHPDSVIDLDPLQVSVARIDLDGLTAIQRLTLPVGASIDARKAREIVNLLDTEDAVKYLPSLFLRKRNNGDTQAVMGTRVWGVSSSARSLIFADGIPLTALIANNNTIGGPRWGLVGPAEIERVDVMYGPFSAAYAGNSMGAVMEITTRLPERFEGSIAQTQAYQRFDLYGTRSTYGTAQTSGSVGGRVGKASAWVSTTYQNSHSQPLTYVTGATFPANTTGGFPEANKLGATANVLGAGGLLHTRMLNSVVKLAYDLTPTVRASYRFGLWRNDADAEAESYLERTDAPTFAGQSGFASGSYDLYQRHTAHGVAVRSDTKGAWDFEATATRFAFDRDRQRTPTSASGTGTTFGQAGRVALLEGTGWTTADLKGTWRPGGLSARNALSAGVHADRYRLENPTYNTSDWVTGEPRTGLATLGSGKTRTAALWIQDVVRLTPALKMTVGVRQEWWRAYDGRNVNGATTVEQPGAEESRLSPKATLAWEPEDSPWSLNASIGKAYRFPTTAELYQLVTTGTTFTSPAPDLKPDDVLATELRVGRTLGSARVQIALFQDDVHDAVISQFLPLVAGSSTLYSYLSNVDHVRARGVEGTLYGTDVLVRGLEMAGSVTWLDAKTLALSGRASATAPAGSAIGKQLPNIPTWRATYALTYRPTSRLSGTFAGRYSSKLYTTLDNADVNPNTYQGFAAWFVADTRVTYRIARTLTGSVGVDNLFDRKYFLFHPFPHRTFVAELKADLR